MTRPATREAKIAPDAHAAHPAFRAWQRIDASSPLPGSIDTLKEQRDAGVYRLAGVTRQGLPVIAKQRLPGGLAGEARMYLDVLPAIPLPVPACHGYVDDFEGHAWLFLEDVGARGYSADDPAHRARAIDWLARLHATDGNAMADLPDCGTAYFRSVLDAARQGTRQVMSHSAAPARLLAGVAPLPELLDRVEGRWPCVEQVCSRVPATLVHGDFVDKNLRMRGSRTEGHLVAFDWETAGIGTPASDIAQIPGGSRERRRYGEALRRARPGVSAADIESLFRIGTVFRLLHAVQWDTYTFAATTDEQALANLAMYQHALREVMLEPHWAGG